MRHRDEASMFPSLLCCKNKFNSMFFQPPLFKEEPIQATTLSIGPQYTTETLLYSSLIVCHKKGSRLFAGKLLNIEK